MKIYIHELEYAISFLYRLNLKDYSSRMRTRVLKLLSERYQQYKDEYVQLVKEHARLDEQGEPVIIAGETGQRYAIDDPEEFSRTLEPLLYEQFVIEANENNKAMMQSVAQSVLHCDLSFEGDEQFQYDRLAEIFEAIPDH
ncbi:hypothetical protein M6D81_15350 [Paenibacillus sp. J5C_2022]|uniref:hypothetical protein n=1 Tax=Paenibacillus sp. J5C2022 TaxID=2977129 RepID=UPI0021D20105|nr:hypothetical protein [Paenibacillus sp. J5C2022]MCU6710072.1 hypothetical protein [Paenibacillus sp. J5C2022]